MKLIVWLICCYITNRYYIYALTYACIHASIKIGEVHSPWRCKVCSHENIGALNFVRHEFHKLIAIFSFITCMHRSGPMLTVGESKLALGPKTPTANFAKEVHSNASPHKTWTVHMPNALTSVPIRWRTHARSHVLFTAPEVATELWLPFPCFYQHRKVINFSIHERCVLTAMTDWHTVWRTNKIIKSIKINTRSKTNDRKSNTLTL